MINKNVLVKKAIEYLRNEGFTFGCVLLVAALPFSIRFTSKAIILMVILWLLQNNYKRLGEVLRKSTVFWLFGSLFLAMLASLCYTENLKSGMRILEKDIPLFLFPILFASSRPIPIKNIYLIIKVFVLSNICFGVVSLIYATYVYWSLGENIFFYHDLVTPLFESHATYFSIYIIFSLVAVLFFISKVHNPSIGVKISVLTLVIFFSTLIYLLSVRSITLLYSLAVIVSIIVYVLKTKNIKLGMAMLVGFVLLITLALKNNPVLIERLTEVITNYKYQMSAETTEGYNGLTTRLAQWESSLSIIKEHPIFGVGPGDMQDELQIVYKKNFLTYCYLNEWNAHNMYVQIALGLGLVGLSIFLMNIIVPMIKAYKQMNVLYLTFLILFVFCSVTESTLLVQKGVVFYSFFQTLFYFHLLDNSTPRI